MAFGKLGAVALALLLVLTMLSALAHTTASTTPAAEPLRKEMLDRPVELSPASSDYLALDASHGKQPESRGSAPGDRMAEYPGDDGFRPRPLPRREASSGENILSAHDSYIFYDDFESGTSKWTIGNLGSSSTQWAATTDRPAYGNYSMYCAGANPVLNQEHTVFYDTAEYMFQELKWDMGDYNPDSGLDYWAGTDNRSSPRYLLMPVQDFSGATFPPTGWAQSGPSSQWVRSATDYATGTSPEARFNYVNNVGTWRLYAGPMDTGGLNRVDLRFRQFFWDYDIGVTVKVETSSNGATWNDAGWSIASGGGNAAEYVSLALTTQDVGSDTFYVSWTVEGDAYQLNYWFIDDVRLTYESWSYYCAGEGEQAARADHEARRNDTNVEIPADATRVFSELKVDEAPAGSVIDYIELYAVISHPRHADLIIDLEDTDITDTVFERLWNQGTGSGTLTISRTVAGGNRIDTFNGDAVNQRWRLYALDRVTGNTGYIDYWWIKVHYTNDRMYDSNQTSYMKQAVDLSGQTDCNLSFHFWLDTEAGNDGLVAMGSTTNYADPLDPGWTILAGWYSTQFDSQNLTSQQYHSRWLSSGNIDISAFDGQTMYLMFLFYSDIIYEREGAYIDNIRITGYGKSYANNMDTYAEIDVDLTGYDNAYLSFVYWMDAEDYYDVFNVSVKRSTDTAWTPILTLNNGTDEWQYDGADPDLMARTWWYTGHLSLDAFCGDPAVAIRFWFKSDGSVTREGMYIDEVEIASIFFFDDMESGVGDWVTTSAEQPNWHLVTTNYYSYSHSWWCGNDTTGKYGGSMDEYMIHSFDLRAAENARLRFLLTGHTYENDYLFVGISMDNGENWHYYGALTGDYPVWWQFEIDLSQYIHSESLVAFNMYTNKSQESIGYWIDDVSVYGTRDRTPPGQVINLSVESGVEGESLALVWDANPEIDLSHYKIYRSLTSGGPYDHVANASSNSYLDTGLIKDTTYYYVVSALDFAGNEGLTSLEAGGTTNDTMPPGPVQDVAANDTKLGGSVNVTWLPNNEKDLAGYNIYYSTTDFTDASLATYYPLSPADDAGATYWEVCDLDNDVQYHFAVTAIDKSGNENRSIEKTAIATPTDQTPPFVNIGEPTDNSTVSGTVNITVLAGDNSGIASVFIYINKGAPVEATYDGLRWVYQWNTATVLDGEVLIEAEATDLYGNKAMDNVTVIKETVEAPYYIDLSNHSGNSWAFVSFPVNISGNIQDVLNDAIHGDGLTTWSVAKTYDNLNKRWITYRPGYAAPFHVDNTMGMWLYLTANGGDKKLTTGLAGYYPDSEMPIQLYAGWNMVGYPSGTPRNASEALTGTDATMVSIYQPTSPYIQDRTDLANVPMSEGNAYWVWVPADVQWVIPSPHMLPPGNEATRGGAAVPGVPEAEQYTSPGQSSHIEARQGSGIEPAAARFDWMALFLPAFSLALACLALRRLRRVRSS